MGDARKGLGIFLTGKQAYLIEEPGGVYPDALHQLLRPPGVEGEVGGDVVDLSTDGQPSVVLPVVSGQLLFRYLERKAKLCL